MYVSGKILKEVIDGCRDQTIDFTNNKVIFGNATLTYYGNFHINLTFLSLRSRHTL